MDGIPSPNPTYKQDIHNVTGTIKEVVGNKNLAKPWFQTQTKSGVTCTYTKEGWKLNGTLSEVYSSFVLFKNTLVAGTYTVNGIAGASNSKYQLLVRKGSTTLHYITTSSQTFTLAEDTEITLQLYIYQSYGTFNNLLLPYQLEPGDTATPYVPHAEQNLPFTLQEGQKMFARDYLEDDGIHHVRGEKVFDGTENWLDYMTQVEGYYKAYATSKKTNAYFYTNAICSHFTVKSVTGQNISSASEMIGSNQNATYISISSSIASNVTELKSWLAEQYANGTPVTAEYELAEEVIDPYTETQQAQYNAIKKAMSYKDTTVITLSSDDADPTTTAVAVRDMSNFNPNDIDEIKTAIVALGGVI